MIRNLQELQYNLSSLIGQFQEIRKKLITPLQSKKNNQSTLLVKLPKMILIIKICPYLDYYQIIKLSNVCSVIRKSIFGPIGWKLLNRMTSPYPIIIKQNISDEFKYKINDYSDMDHFFPPEDEKNLRKSRLQCKKQLMQLYDRYKQRQQQYGELQKKLKSQKTQIKKLSMSRQYFQKIQMLLHQQNSSYKNELKLTNIGFSDKIKQLDKENEILIEQNNKLQNQKGALVNKIRDYQNEIDNIKIESQKSKAILKKL